MIKESNVQRVFFVIPPRVHLLDISGPIHVFYEAAELGASLNSYFLTMDASEEVSSAGLTMNKLEAFGDYHLNENDIIIIPGLDKDLILGGGLAQNKQGFFDWVYEQFLNGARVCSVCTGAYILAQSGILDGKECTTHWKYIKDLRERFPKVRVHDDRLFVKSGKVYSSAGVSSGIDLSLFLLEELYGPIFATQVAKEIVVFLRRAEEDPQLSVFLQYRNHIEARVHSVQDWLAQNLDQATGIDELAENVHMSSRNLTRVFKKTTGITIGQYVDKLRVERAVQLLAAGEKIESVARDCGLKSTNQLRTLLKKYKSALPSDLS